MLTSNRGVTVIHWQSPGVRENCCLVSGWFLSFINIVQRWRQSLRSASRYSLTQIQASPSLNLVYTHSPKKWVISCFVLFLKDWISRSHIQTNQNIKSLMGFLHLLHTISEFKTLRDISSNSIWASKGIFQISNPIHC